MDNICTLNIPTFLLHPETNYGRTNLLLRLTKACILGESDSRTEYTSFFPTGVLILHREDWNNGHEQ